MDKQLSPVEKHMEEGSKRPVFPLCYRCEVKLVKDDKIIVRDNSCTVYLRCDKCSAKYKHKYKSASLKII